MWLIQGHKATGACILGYCSVQTNAVESVILKYIYVLVCNIVTFFF